MFQSIRFFMYQRGNPVSIAPHITPGLRGSDTLGPCSLETGENAAFSIFPSKTPGISDGRLFVTP